MRKFISLTLFLSISLLLTACASSDSIQTTNGDQLEGQELALYEGKVEEINQDDADRVLKVFQPDTKESPVLDHGIYSLDEKNETTFSITKEGSIEFSKKNKETDIIRYYDLYLNNPLTLQGAFIQDYFPAQELSFMSSKEAISMAEKLLSDLNYDNVKLIKLYSFNEKTAKKAPMAGKGMDSEQEKTLKFSKDTEFYGLHFEKVSPNETAFSPIVFGSLIEDIIFNEPNYGINIFISKDGIINAQFCPNWKFKETGETVNIISPDLAIKNAEQYYENLLSATKHKVYKPQLKLMTFDENGVQGEDNNYKYVYLLPTKEGMTQNILLIDAITGEVLPVKILR